MPPLIYLLTERTQQTAPAYQPYEFPHVLGLGRIGTLPKSLIQFLELGPQADIDINVTLEHESVHWLACAAYCPGWNALIA
jgi:hypothetical protein